MQRHKSVEKRVRQNKKANIANKMSRSGLKSAIKDVIDSTDKENAEKAYRKAESILDKSVKSGLIHKNKAANRKSSLSKLVHALGK